MDETNKKKSVKVREGGRGERRGDGREEERRGEREVMPPESSHYLLT